MDRIPNWNWYVPCLYALIQYKSIIFEEFPNIYRCLVETGLVPEYSVLVTPE